MSDTTVTAARAALAAGLRVSSSVRAAFVAVPRHEFLPGLPASEAYRDAAVVIDSDADGLPVSAATQPAMMAVMLDQLDLRPGQRVLEIGTGTGYNAALLAYLAADQARVVSVEVDRGLANRARTVLAAAGYGGVRVVCADGALGAPEQAPFDRVIVTAGAWVIPPAWLWQLGPGGRIVLPLSVRGIQLSVALDRCGNRWESRSSCRCGFVRMTGSAAGPEVTLPLGPQPGLHAVVTDGANPSATALYAALSGPAREVFTGISAAGVAELASLDLWLALSEPDLGRVNLLGRHDRNAASAEQRRVARLMPLGGFVSGTGSRGLGVATLAPAGGDPTSGPSQIAVRGYGPGGPGLAAHLARQAAVWDRLGKPGTDRLALTVYPPGAPAGDLSGRVLIERPHTVLAVGWQDPA